MTAVCPDALMLQYVNPMAINTWAIAERYPAIRQVGLCHSVQNTVVELAHDLGIDKADVRYKRRRDQPHGVLPAARTADGGRLASRSLPFAARGLSRGPHSRRRTPGNRAARTVVRYEMMTRLGYFPTESSEHFAEYVPWFIKSGREDLIDRFRIPLDEYPKRCEEQMAGWAEQAETLRAAETSLPVERSHEFAADLMNAVVTDTPVTIYGNLPNHRPDPATAAGRSGRDAVPRRCQRRSADHGDRHSTPQLIALMRSNINVQELTVRALVDQTPRPHLPRRDDGPAHGSGAGSRSDPRAGRRPSRGASATGCRTWLRGRAAA